MENTLQVSSAMKYQPIAWTILGISGIYALLSLLVRTPELLILTGVGLLCGLVLLGAGTRTVTFAPEGITVAFGRHRCFYPRELIRFLYYRERLYRGHIYRNIWASMLTIEELAQLRKARLEKGIMTRQELPFRLRNPNWQQIFAKEYMDRSLDAGRNLPLLGTGDDLGEFLLRMYPEIPMHRYSSNRDGALRPPPDDSTPFCRGYHPGELQEAAPMLLFFLPVLLPLVLVFALDLTTALAICGVTLLPVLCLVAVFLCLPQRETDRLDPRPEGLCILRRDAVIRRIAPEEITLITEFSNSSGRWIAISTLPMEEMIARQRARMKRYPWIRWECQPVLAQPDWEIRLARSFVSSLAVSQGLDPRIQVMRSSTERLRTLYETYPNVPFLPLYPWAE